MATMRDVAKRAGVSYTTVSYVLNRRDTTRGIGAETRRRVLQAAEDLEYRPNELARAVVTGANRLIAFLSNDSPLDTEFRMRVQTGVLEEASAHGYVVKLLSHTGPESLLALIEQCAAWRLAGVVAAGLGQETIDILQAKLGQQGIPMATVEEERPAEATFFNALSDERQGFRLAMRHLYDLGHRHIAYLSAAEFGNVNSLRRVASYRAVRAELGLLGGEADIAYGDWWDIPSNQRAARELLLRPAGRRPTAIVCCGDPPAVVAINVARSMGLSVPGDISIVGFGDYTMALYADPPLTTLWQPFGESGRLAAGWLITRADRRGIATVDALTEPGERTLETRLVVRGSTGVPKLPGEVS